MPPKKRQDEDDEEEEDEEWLYEEEEIDDSALEEDDAEYLTEANDEECGICKDIGELVLCDYCPKAYHAKCVGLKVRIRGGFGRMAVRTDKGENRRMISGCST